MSGVNEELRPISHQSTNDKIFELVKPHLGVGVRMVDVGAGEGYFSKKVGDFVQTTFGSPAARVISACDLFPKLFRYPEVVCDPIEPDGGLPYDDNTFDVVCSLEVIEHIQDQFAFTRELVRIAKPGGTIIISTPNVLNLNSRLRTLYSGFSILFNPLPIAESDPVHTSGHIHPISYYYLAYQLYQAGVGAVDVQYDRFKTSARSYLALWWPFITLGQAGFRARLERKGKKLEPKNQAILQSLNSKEMLTARSIIAVATK